VSEPQSTCPVRVASETTLSTHGSTRATLYNWANKIVTHEGRTHVGWLDYLAWNRMRTLDHATGEWGEVVTVGDGFDNHSGPALAIDEHGRLHAMVGAHGTSPFQYRASLEPNDAALWQPPIQVGARPTYPSLVCDRENRLHLAYRGRGIAPSWLPNRPAPHLMYQQKPAGGAWRDPVELVRSGEPYGYTQWGNGLCIDRRNRLHLVFHMYEGHPDGRGHTAGYMRSADGGITWTAADGSAIAIPAGRKTVDVLSHSPDLNFHVSNVACDAADRPHVIVFGEPEAGHADLHWHDGTAWAKRPLLDAVRQVRPDCFISQDATLAFDRDDNLYIALHTVTEADGWGGPGSHVVLLFSADGGRTFTGIPVSHDDDQPNWQPSLERVSGFYQDTPQVPRLMYTHGTKGVGCASEHYTEVRFVTLERL